MTWEDDKCCAAPTIRPHVGIVSVFPVTGEIAGSGATKTEGYIVFQEEMQMGLVREIKDDKWNTPYLIKRAVK
jgi:hypothetical protein